MSITALGERAKTGHIQSTTVDIPFAGVGQITSTITFADNGTELTPKGLFIVTTAGGNTAMTLPDGIKQGDAVEIIYFHSGGNAFTLTVANLHGAVNKTITTGPAVSGQYYKLVWVDVPGIGSGWVVTARESLADAADNAVAGMPVIA